ncbi:hypothetical protein NC651_039861 [Populus alba x Populus x berolinensis]|nr:hypothetical protein NC651_039861 [Populus alba x Populus x berolinensis]
MTGVHVCLDCTNISHVCFPESSFRKIIFQTFLCLFVIRKVGQRKTLSGQRKTLSSQFQSKKNLTWFSRECFFFSCVCFSESDFREITFQTFLCLFASTKVGQWKTLSSIRKIWLGFQESVFLKNLGGKHFPEVVKNLEMSLFADYIKFHPQTFDYYIYFVLNIYFLISSLKILFLY